MITGLCRGLKWFQPGDRYIYVTHVNPSVARRIGCLPYTRYLGVASVVVERVFTSHIAAAECFAPRKYVVAPEVTPYPPGLAHDPDPIAAVHRSSCIVHAHLRPESTEVPLTPDRSTDQLWRAAYGKYHARNQHKQLCAALCRFEEVDGEIALATKAERAVQLEPKHWGGKRLNINGIVIQSDIAKSLTAGIAKGRTSC